MSSFQRWCGQAQAVLSAAGVKVSYSQVQQLLARSLGHQFYASFQKADLAEVDGARYAVADSAAFLGRAAQMEIAVTEEISNDLFMDLRHDYVAPTLVRTQYFEYPARMAFPSVDHPALAAIRQELERTLAGHTIDHARAVWAEPEGDLPESASWYWSVRGTLLASYGDDALEVPFTAKMELPKVGRRLLAQPLIHNLQQSGPPVPWDDDIGDYGYVSDSDD